MWLSAKHECLGKWKNWLGRTVNHRLGFQFILSIPDNTYVNMNIKHSELMKYSSCILSTQEGFFPYFSEWEGINQLTQDFLFLPLKIYFLPLHYYKEENSTPICPLLFQWRNRWPLEVAFSFKIWVLYSSKCQRALWSKAPKEVLGSKCRCTKGAN